MNVFFLLDNGKEVDYMDGNGETATVCFEYREEAAANKSLTEEHNGAAGTEWISTLMMQCYAHDLKLIRIAMFASVQVNH